MSDRLPCASYSTTLICLPCMIANWKRRTEIVQYCVGVVDQSMDSKRMAIEAETEDPAAQRRIQGALYAEEVKVPIRALIRLLCFCS